MFARCAAQNSDADLDQVNDLVLNNTVKAPVAGASPVVTPITRKQYSGTVSWMDKDGNALSETDTFELGKVYKAILNLEAESGYRFIGLGENSFSYSGASVKSKAHLGDNVTIVFPPAKEEPAKKEVPVFDYAPHPNSDGSLYYDLTLTMGALPNDKTIKDSLQATSDKWDDFVDKLDPLPFLVPTGGGTKNYEVWIEDDGKMVLDNSGATGNLVIRRYWKPAWGTLTVGTWPGTNAQRKAAFLEAKEKIEALMADLQASPYWNESYDDEGTTQFPLKELHASMGDFIKVPTTGTLYTDRGLWDKDDLYDNGSTSLVPAKTGPLYELYFGHIPAKSEYANQSGPFVYPVN
jgi:hypothetical protein